LRSLSHGARERQGTGVRFTLNTTRAKRAIVPYLYQAPTMVLLAVLMLVPIVTVVHNSLLNNVIVVKNPIPVGLQNYKTVLADEPFRISLGNTLYFTVLSVIFHLLVGLCFAMLLNAKVVVSVQVV
jgi:multiple sugar transport system permease protein